MKCRKLWILPPGIRLSLYPGWRRRTRYQATGFISRSYTKLYRSSLRRFFMPFSIFWMIVVEISSSISISASRVTFKIYATGIDHSRNRRNISGRLNRHISSRIMCSPGLGGRAGIVKGSQKWLGISIKAYFFQGVSFFHITTPRYIDLSCKAGNSAMLSNHHHPFRAHFFLKIVPYIGLLPMIKFLFSFEIDLMLVQLSQHLFPYPVKLPCWFSTVICISSIICCGLFFRFIWLYDQTVSFFLMWATVPWKNSSRLLEKNTQELDVPVKEQ